MIFSIVVLGSPYSSQSADTALRFTRAALESGNKIYRVFFYHDGVFCGNHLSTPPQDENNIPDCWQQLAFNHSIDMVVCIAAALKRGILDDKEAKRYNHEHHNLKAPFELSGLGQLVDASINSDRVITFAP
jgi:tRNA 2-thiouridine synthesizing protein D